MPRKHSKPSIADMLVRYRYERQHVPPSETRKLRVEAAKIRETILERDHHRCVICGFDLVVEVHHIRQVRNGGENDPNNLVTLCPNHHALADRGLITESQLRDALPEDLTDILPGFDWK